MTVGWPQFDRAVFFWHIGMLAEAVDAMSRASTPFRKLLRARPMAPFAVVILEACVSWPYTTLLAQEDLKKKCQDGGPTNIIRCPSTLLGCWVLRASVYLVRLLCILFVAWTRGSEVGALAGLGGRTTR
jgi:hypothetical protein